MVLVALADVDVVDADEVDVDDSCINRRTCKTIMVGEVVSQRSAAQCGSCRYAVRLRLQ